MTAQASIPLKWYVPFANGDAGRTELPVTTADPTRASQTLGFPPLTMQPPESGGVPPQGEDFNGGMNQVARITWWTLNGGGWPFDATFATNSNINGYPNGALIQSADFRGYWLNTLDNNQINPDTVGTGWVPAFQYGSTAVATTGGTTTLTPAQAAKQGLSFTGVLASNATIIVPNWIKSWDVSNATTGAFALTVKTAAGSGIVIPQNGATTAVAGDGTNVTQSSRNIATGTNSTQAATIAQTVGRLLNVQYFLAAGTSTYTPTAGTTSVVVECIGGGSAGGGAPATGAGTFSMGGGGASGGYSRSRLTSGFSGQTVVVGAGGTGVSGAAGNNGGNTTFGGTIVTANAGTGGAVGGPSGSTGFIAQPGGGGAVGTGSVASGGNPGTPGLSFNSLVIGGNGGPSVLGGAGGGAANAGGQNATGAGAGGGGSSNLASAAARSGASGSPGAVIIWEYI